MNDRGAACNSKQPSFDEWDNIKSVLEAWANTRRVHRFGTEYPSGSFLYNKSPEYFPVLHEVEAMTVDAAVLKLRRYDLRGHAILTKFYLDGFSCTHQAKVICKATSYVTAYLSRAESYIAGQIDFFPKNNYVAGSA